MQAIQAKKKKRKLRIRSKNKTYLLKDSCLYNISTKSKLCKILFSNQNQLEKLANDSNYKVFSIEKSNGERRLIETPNEALNVIHTRIASLLVRVKQPDFIHSGVKGRSNITNAKAHVGEHPVLTMDLEKFYPSVSKKSIFYFFHEVLQCSPDVSGMLAELCSYDSHLPTGSRISMPLSFWANYKMYSDLDKLSTSKNLTMSVYVDDLTFSGSQADKRLQKDVERIVSSAGLVINSDKTRIFRANDPKIITGVVIHGNDLRVRNKHHKAIHNLFNQRDEVSEEDLLEAIDKKLIGHLNAAGQIDKKFKQKAVTLRTQSS